jgi:hypothetical protein
VTRRPSPAQLAAIDYFTSVADGDLPRVDSTRTNTSTYEACVRNGWLVPMDHFPYHAPTDAGRAVLSAAKVRTTTIAVDESALRVLQVAIEHASENEAFNAAEDEVASRLYGQILQAIDQVSGGVR